MRRPKYFVSFGGFNLQNVTNVHDENEREIEEYDGVGAGKFNVPQPRSPHTWKIECTLEEDPPDYAESWRASEIFKAMDALLENSTEPSRLVITNLIYPAASVSVLAWFKSYSKDETSPGIYKTTVELEEYIPVGVQTTDIPYVERPGKAPVPTTVTISSSNTVYKNKQKTGVGTKVDAIVDAINNRNVNHNDDSGLYLTQADTGEPVTNAANVDSEKIYAPKTVSSINPYSPSDSVSAKDQLQGVVDVIKGVGDAINNATGGFLGKWWDAAMDPDTWKW
jgi:hypothetical protein